MEVDAPTAMAGFCLSLLRNSHRAAHVDDAEVRGVGIMLEHAGLSVVVSPHSRAMSCRVVLTS